jgi:hypothetical protein
VPVLDEDALDVLFADPAAFVSAREGA